VANFFDWLSDYFPFKTDTALWSSVSQSVVIIWILASHDSWCKCMFLYFLLVCVCVN